MFTQAVKCDAPGCEAMRPVSTIPGDPGDGAFEGWIVMHVNRPMRYSWRSNLEDVSSLVGSFDCCSVACARNVLGLATDHMPEVVTVDAQA